MDWRPSGLREPQQAGAGRGGVHEHDRPSKAVSNSSPTTATASSTGPTLAQYQEFYVAAAEALHELALARPAANADHAQFAHAHTVLSQADPNSVADLHIVAQVYNYLLAWFVNHRDVIRRRTVVGGPHEASNDATGARGRRYPAMRQFFAECGQMAAFNAIFMDLGQLPPNDDALATHLGAFGQNITEDDIRAMITADRPDLPVIGDLEQVHGAAAQLDAGNVGHLNMLHIDAKQQRALDAYIQFAYGVTNVLTVVVNTMGHLPMPGVHWIAVQMVRQPGVHLTIEYLDAFDADSDYTDLFTALRAIQSATNARTVIPRAGACFTVRSDAVTRATTSSYVACASTSWPSS